MQEPSRIQLPARVILYPDRPEGPAGYAAEEWARCLGQAGVQAETASGERDGAPFVIRLSCTGDPALPDGAFRCAVDEKGILITSGVPAGLVYGTYAVLEKLGWRFLTPDCEVTPVPPLRLARGSWEEHPAFQVREVFWRSAMDGAFAVRLRLNASRSTITDRQGGKAMFYNFSHTFDQLVPVSKYFDTHPEYFSMIGGKRQRERTQLCLTNPDVLRLCVDGVLRWKREHPAYDIFSVSMNDWYSNCQCPDCRRIDEEEGSGAGTMIRFVNAVARETRKVFPDIRIHTFAYLYCRKPPRLTRPEDNVIVRLCPIEACYSHPIARCGCETGPIDVQYTHARAFTGSPDAESTFMRDLKGWSRICGQLYIWDYTTNYANYLQPFPNLSVLAENLRTFRAYGVKGVLEQGNFSLGRVSALGDLKVYLLGHLLWNPDLDPGRLIREFAEGCWGPAADEMISLAELFEQAVRPYHMSIYDAPDAAYLDDGTLRQAERLISQALLKTAGPAHERVEREALSIRYVRLAQEDPDAPGHAERVDAFGSDVRRLGISELFERRDLDGSIEVLRRSRLTADRSAARPIRYPF